MRVKALVTIGLLVVVLTGCRYVYKLRYDEGPELPDEEVAIVKG